MRQYRAWAKTFALLLAWDWLVAVGTINLAERALLAVPLAVGLTAFWWVATRVSLSNPWLIIPASAGAACGTFVGILFP